MSATRCFELRTYVANEGKLEALQRRFREHTCRLFQKHGMDLIGFWTPLDGEEADHTLIYMLAHPSREAADTAWARFRADPEWIAAARESERDGRLVKRSEARFLAPTDYSALR